MKLFKDFSAVAEDMKSNNEEVRALQGGGVLVFEDSSEAKDRLRKGTLVLGKYEYPSGNLILFTK
ncbi:MAG: hypothetical protein WDZ88_02785 [Candidatus Paceibacterota bacterium]